jgi:hypothetical protein
VRATSLWAGIVREAFAGLSQLVAVSEMTHEGSKVTMPLNSNLKVRDLPAPGAVESLTARFFATIVVFGVSMFTTEKLAEAVDVPDGDQASEVLPRLVRPMNPFAALEPVVPV